MHKTAMALLAEFEGMQVTPKQGIKKGRTCKA